jgi:hypothetical protein
VIVFELASNRLVQDDDLAITNANIVALVHVYPVSIIRTFRGLKLRDIWRGPEDPEEFLMTKQSKRSAEAAARDISRDQTLAALGVE